MQDAKRIARALSRLLATFPTFASGDGRTALEVYYEVISDHDAGDIERVVKLFINGLVEGQSLIYLPTAPMFANQLRMVKVDRMSADSWRRRAIAQIEAGERERAERPPIEDRRQAVAAHMRRLREPEPEDEAEKRRQRLRAQHDPMFVDADPRPLGQRLRLGGEE